MALGTYSSHGVSGLWAFDQHHHADVEVAELLRVPLLDLFIVHYDFLEPLITYLILNTC